MDFKEDIKPITEFRNHAKEIIDRTHKTRQPVIITQRGEASAVVWDIEAYQQQLERLRLLEAIAAGKADVLAGKTTPHKQVLKELRECLEK